VHTYEIRQGERAIALQDGNDAQEAVLEYIRSCGSREDEIQRIGPGKVAWRGAIFHAVPAPPNQRSVPD
jgi:hypothetical protein